MTNITPLIRKTATFYGQVVFPDTFVRKNLPVSGQNISGHLFESLSRRQACDSSPGAGFERMTGCLSGSVSGNQFREATFVTLTDVCSQILGLRFHSPDACHASG